MYQLGHSWASTARTSGSTHGVYRYPARFHPQIAREIICRFSAYGDWILDPFMGGGTSVVEGLSLGRQVVGSDVNSLAQFISDVRTRPLSSADMCEVRLWARTVASRLSMRDLSWVPRPMIINLPREAEIFLSGAIELSRGMVPRRRNFARAVLLRLGQLTLDCRDFNVPCRTELGRKLVLLVEEIASGLDELVELCCRAGVSKKSITTRRLLLHRNAVGLEKDRRLRSTIGRPRLVLTSPPYPAVHVLYHRWQYRGRRETPAPYWIANVADGFGPKYYCGGSRTPTGLRKYFNMIVDAFSSIARVMHPEGRVVQIVGFSDVKSQMPAYLGAMEQAGFEDIRQTELGGEFFARRVPNRKWYAEIKGANDASTEFLFVHGIRR